MVTTDVKKIYKSLREIWMTKKYIYKVKLSKDRTHGEKDCLVQVKLIVR